MWSSGLYVCKRSPRPSRKVAYPSSPTVSTRLSTGTRPLNTQATANWERLCVGAKVRRVAEKGRMVARLGHQPVV